jgi:hypothetical protein
MPSFKMPTPIKRPQAPSTGSARRLRGLIGKTEIWASLGTKDQRRAAVKIGAVNAEIEAEWARLRAGGPPGPARELDPPPFKLSHQDLHALRRDEHIRVRNAWIKDPPEGFGKLRMHAWADEESLQLDAVDLLESGGYDASMANIERLKPLLVQARREAIEDVEHARAGEYKKIADLSSIPPRTTPALDFIKAFEEFAVKGGLKGGKFGPSAKRWRPKIKAFCDFIGHRDLKRMTTADGYEWADHLIEKEYAHKSIKDVWLAALSATAGFMVERRKLDQNPFLRLKVRERQVGGREGRVEGQVAAAGGAASQGIHPRGSGTDPDRDPGHSERPDLGRDARGKTLAAVALRLQRRARQRTHQPVPGRHPCRQERASHGHQAHTREDRAMARRPDPLARDRAGFHGLRGSTAQGGQTALLRSGPQPRRSPAIRSSRRWRNASPHGCTAST